MSASHPTIRPLIVEGRSYELLDMGGKSQGRFFLLGQVLEAIAEWPRRTCFVVRLWTQGSGTLAVERQWLMCRELDGGYRTRPIRRHWTICNERVTMDVCPDRR